MGEYEVGMILAGVAVFGAVILPRLLSDKPMSFPIIYVGAGMVVFSLPLGLPVPDPVSHGDFIERLAEFVVIVALMGAGLKLDRPFDWSAWSTSWRLLGITMPITVVVTTLLGWGLLGALAPTAILLGAVLAPTDPVLASDVQVSRPTESTDEEVDPSDQEGEVRFTLTSEAGLNDGLAFPFTYLAIGAAAAMVAGDTSFAWLGDWALTHVVYEIGAGVVVGYLSGQFVARVIFRGPVTTNLGKVMEGAEALATALVTYGVAELLSGYGFIAVFVAALELRHYEWEHEYYLAIHDYAVMTERIVLAGGLVLLGGAIAGGLFDQLTWLDAAFALVLVFVVRPVAGAVALLGTSMSWLERLIIAGFGIRGIASFYYLAYALNHPTFANLGLALPAERLWAVVGFVVMTSILVHGVAANPAMMLFEYRERNREGSSEA